MFDIAFSELVLIGLVALVVLGPRRLQEVARTAGRWMARLRRFVDDVKRDMDAELRQSELAELRNVQQQLVETKEIIEKSTASAFAGLSSIQPPESDYAVKAIPDAAESPAAAGSARPGPAAGKTTKPRKKTAPRKSTAPAKSTKRAAHGRTARKSR